jgi:hypothetical protein
MRPGRITRSTQTAVLLCLDGSESMSGQSSMAYTALRNKFDAVHRLQNVPREQAEQVVRSSVGLVLAELFDATTIPDLLAQLEASVVASAPLLDVTKNKRWNYFQYAQRVTYPLSAPSSIVLTNGAALALHDALRGVKVPHEITQFVDDQYKIIKPFRSPYINPVTMKYMNTTYCMSGTPAAEAWARSVGSLMLRREQRKVLIVMTDGGTNRDQSAVSVLRMAMKAHIEVYGLGIGAENLSNIFDTIGRKHACVTAVGSVIKPLLDLVKRVLNKEGSK